MKNNLFKDLLTETRKVTEEGYRDDLPPNDPEQNYPASDETPVDNNFESALMSVTDSLDCLDIDNPDVIEDIKGIQIETITDGVSEMNNLKILSDEPAPLTKIKLVPGFNIKKR